MPARPFHLGWFLQGSSVQAWGEPWTGHIGATWMLPELFLDMARSLERACFDYILLEDCSYVGESYNGSTELYLKHGIAVPRQDPSVVASLMTAVTSRIGIVPTFGTYAYPPYLLARLMATLDQVSQGRAGWNAVTGSSDFAAMNFGLKGMPEHDLRYEMADEYMEVVRALWGSWEPGAIVADRASRRAGRSRQGPRGQPRRPILQDPRPAEFRTLPAGAAGDRPGRRLAARPAVRRAASPTRSSRMPRASPAMKAYRADIRAPHGGASGRDPDDCKVLFMVAPIIGETEAEAQERKRRCAWLGRASRSRNGSRIWARSPTSTSANSTSISRLAN